MKNPATNEEEKLETLRYVCRYSSDAVNAFYIFLSVFH